MSKECDDQDPDPGGGEKLKGENLTFVGIKRETFDFVKGEAQNPNGDESAGAFFLYAMSFQESIEEERMLFQWCCDIVDHLGIKSVQKVGDWRNFGLRDEWPVDPPVWAVEREMEDIEEEVRNGSREREEEVKKLVVENVVAMELKGVMINVENEEVPVVDSDVGVRDMVELAVELREVMRMGENEEVTAVAERDVVVSDMVESYVEDRDEVEKEEVLEMEREIGVVEKEVLEELVEKVSPILKPGWGGSLLPATCSPPPLPFSPTRPWRPWEGHKKGHGRKKRKSPSSARRSRNRLLLWQERRDSSRHQAELMICTATPHKPSSGLVATCLARKFQPGVEGGSPLDWNRTQPTKEGKEPGSQALPPSQWSGNQTFPPSPPWSGAQGIVHQGYRLSASTPTNQIVLQQSLPPLVPLPPPIPGSSSPPSSCWNRPAGGCTWGTLPALVTTCPSCLAWGLLTPP